MIQRFLVMLRRGFRRSQPVQSSAPKSLIEKCLEQPVTIGEWVRLLDRNGNESVLEFTGFGSRDRKDTMLSFTRISEDSAFNAQCVVAWYRVEKVGLLKESETKEKSDV